MVVLLYHVAAMRATAHGNGEYGTLRRVMAALATTGHVEQSQLRGGSEYAPQTLLALLGADVVAQGHMVEPAPPQEQIQAEPDAAAMMDAAFDSQMQAMFTEPEAQHPAQPDPAMHLEQVVEQEFNRLMNAGVPPDMQQPMGPGLM